MRSLGRRATIEPARLALEWLHQGGELLEHRVGKACAHLARVDELAIVVIADEQRTRQSSALAFAFEPAADPQLLAHPVLDLDPGAAALARLVGRVKLLGHDAFEPCLAARLQHRRPASLFVWRRLPRSAFELQCLELFAPAAVGLFQQRMSVLPHDIEKHVRDRDLLHLPPDLRFGREAHSLLDLLEAGAAPVIERHDLAVEYHLRGSERSAHGMDFGVARGDVFAAAAQQADDAAVHISLCPDAVPLELESPGIVADRRASGNPCEHWFDSLGHPLAAWILRPIHAMDHPDLASCL